MTPEMKTLAVGAMETFTKLGKTVYSATQFFTERMEGRKESMEKENVALGVLLTSGLLPLEYRIAYILSYASHEACLPDMILCALRRQVVNSESWKVLRIIPEDSGTYYLLGAAVWTALDTNEELTTVSDLTEFWNDLEGLKDAFHRMRNNR